MRAQFPGMDITRGGGSPVPPLPFNELILKLQVCIESC